MSTFRDRVRRLRKLLDEDVATFGARFGRSGRTVEDWEQVKRQRRPDPLVERELAALERQFPKARRSAPKTPLDKSTGLP